jgi:2-methylisocitrate lyase-like PEP mutase family enzyme
VTDNLTDKTETFAALHVPGDPLILYNIWDAGSAVAVAKAGAKAIATGSWGVAGAHGIGDGEKLPLETALATLAEIVAVTDLPVSIDMEAGYGAGPAGVGASVQRARDAGAVGINLEDKDPVTRTLFSVEDASARIKAAAATGMFAPFLQDAPLIERLCKASPLPVNILIGVRCPHHKTLASLGVARISHGHGPWAAAMDWLEGQARATFESA